MSTGGWGGGGFRKSLKVLKVAVKVILACFGYISKFLLKFCLKLIASEASEDKNEKNSYKNHRSAAVSRRPPPSPWIR